MFFASTKSRRLKLRSTPFPPEWRDILHRRFPLCDMFDDIKTCPEKHLLWFHRCAWDYQMKSGRTLWDELCSKYQEGAKEAAALQQNWQSLAGKMDSSQHKEVADFLAIQVAEAAKWRDQIPEYFGRFSKKPIPTPI